MRGSRSSGSGRGGQLLAGDPPVFTSTSGRRQGQPPLPLGRIARADEHPFDDAAAMGAALASPEAQAVAADMPNFLDPSRVALLVVEEEDVPLPTGSAASPAG